MINKFHIEIAEKYGWFEAILLDNFAYWIDRNEKNELNQYDGKTWTYNSIKAFCEMFPYVSKNKIRSALTHLEEEGLIVAGNYNKSAYDRTKWYTLTDSAREELYKKGYSICGKLKMEVRNIENGFTTDGQMDLSEEGKPIPHNTQHITPQGTTHILRSSVLKDEFERLWSIYPRKQGKSSALKKYEKARKDGATYEEVARGIEDYKEYIDANAIDIRYVKQGATFFSQKAWQDDWSIREERDSGNKKPNGINFGANGSGKRPLDIRPCDVPPKGFRFPDAPSMGYDEET